jgi:hypothetical protein
VEKSAASPARQLAGFLAKFSPEVQSRAKAALATMRKRLPGAIEMVYDNYYALVVGFGPNERPSEAIFSVVIYPRHVSLCFLYGAELDDPQKILQGSGNQVRHIRLEQAVTLDQPEVKALISQAIKASDTPFTRTGRRKMLIRMASAKPRSRRPAPHARTVTSARRRSG